MPRVLRIALSLFICLCLPALAAAEPEDLTPEAARVQQTFSRALVYCNTPDMFGYGVLVDDNKTVLLPAPKRQSEVRDTARKTHCRNGRGWVEAERVEVVQHQGLDESAFVVVHLSSMLNGTPLSLQPYTGKAHMGQQVYAVWHTRREEAGSKGLQNAVEVMTTQLAGVSVSRLSVGAALDPGAVLFDRNGRVMAFVDRAGRLKRLLTLRTRWAPPFPDMYLRGSLRLGVDTDGPVGAGTTSVELEASIGVHERWSVNVSAGYVGSNPSLLGVEPVEGTGPGVVPVSMTGSTMSAEARVKGFEVASIPVALAAGARFRAYTYRTNGPAFYSDSVRCDPRVDACPLTVREVELSPEEIARPAFVIGPVVGADVGMEAFSVGYRYQPGLLTGGVDADTHTIVMGFRLGEL
ncbi:MAG: hypothetical protein ACE366_13165 [Bradymonadia bacterium]